jgi:hypothetical protein
MIATLVHLQVGATSEGNLDLHENFSVSHPRDGYFLDLQIFLAV